MSIKWKTNIVVYDFAPIEQQVLSDVRSKIEIWKSQGLYTGGAEIGPVPGSPRDFMWRRWWWTDEQTAHGYVNMVSDINKGKKIVFDISSEDVPD